MNPRPHKISNMIKDVLGETLFVAKGSIFFLGFFWSVSLSKYWFSTKIAEVMQEKAKATTSTSEIWGNSKMKLPTPKMANHPIQLRNLSNRTKFLMLASIQSFHYELVRVSYHTWFIWSFAVAHYCVGGGLGLKFNHKPKLRNKENNLKRKLNKIKNFWKKAIFLLPIRQVEK